MKKIIFFLAAAIVVFSMSAAPVDQATAAKWAGNFLSNVPRAGKLTVPNGLKLELKKAELSRVLGAGAVYYIYTTDYSYVVVAGDDRAEQILAYGDNALDIQNMPPGMMDMLAQYKDEIEYLQKNPTLKVNPVVSPRNTPSLRAASVGPLLTCNWDQSAPFWNECTFGGYQCYTGCPATSAAMVFYYWKYPREAGLTFYYKVKALYTDGSESAWSNFECVTLFKNGPAYERGDVNGDGNINMADVAILVNYLLSDDATGIDLDAANCNQDDNVNISDVTVLISYLLSGNWN